MCSAGGMFSISGHVSSPAVWLIDITVYRIVTVFFIQKYFEKNNLLNWRNWTGLIDDCSVNHFAWIAYKLASMTLETITTSGPDYIWWI